MIKCNRGMVEVEGSRDTVKAEAICILRTLNEILGEDSVEFIIKTSKMSMGDIRKKTKKLKEKNRIIEEIIGSLFEEKDGE